MHSAWRTNVIHASVLTVPRAPTTTPKALSRETFEKIRDLQIDPKHEGHILSRDIFLFACYTGVPYSDVVSVTDDNLSIDEDGNLWLKYLRRKNENRAAVKLLPEAIALIEKYLRKKNK